jgi:drug/metabolite transporter (DMT)-like permease
MVKKMKNDYKKGDSDRSKDKKKTILMILSAVLVISLAQIIMKKGMSTISLGGLTSLINIPNLVTIFTNVYVVVGLLMNVISLVVWLGAISRTDISLAYPLLSTGYIVITILAIFLLHENVSVTRWFGVGMIFAGSCLIGKS